MTIPENVKRNFKVISFDIHNHPEYIELKKRLEALEQEKEKKEKKQKSTLKLL